MTSLSSSVTLWEKLARYYRDYISGLPNKDEYLRGVQCLRNTAIGGSVSVPSLLKFWNEELNVTLPVLYGATEMGRAITAVYWNEGFEGEVICQSLDIFKRSILISLKRCMGKQISPNMPIKLSNGDHGELLVKGVSTLLG